jgi:hypothetical protein
MKNFLSITTVAGLFLLSGGINGVLACSCDDLTDFTNYDMTLNGSAHVTAGSDAIRLTDDLDQKGSAFLTTSIPVADISTGFSTHFTFQITDLQSCGNQDGADGIVFVIQSNSAAAVGDGGGGIGYKDIPNSIGVEFDTWNNPSHGDIDGNHIGINVNGSVVSMPSVTVSPAMTNGEVWHAWIDYDGTTLEVRVAQETCERPADPVLSYDVNLKDILGDTEAFVGFTSGTGCAGGDHDILCWKFITPPISNSECCDGIDVDTTGIIYIRGTGDLAQFKMKNVTGIGAAAYNALDNGLTFQFGPCDNPIYELTVPGTDLDVAGNRMRYTVGNLDVVRCIFSTEQCVVNIRESIDDLDLYAQELDAALTGPMTVCLKVGDTTYTNTGEWIQFDSGPGSWINGGSWTKYRKDN